jgi:hypothetical protein
VTPQQPGIAVKRLWLESREGREFINEVRMLLRVQHRNLVSLCCCASSAAGAGGPAGHKMLIYPYPDGTLDHFLFGA